MYMQVAGSSFGQNILTTDKLPEVVISGNGDINMLLIPCMSCRWNAWEEFMERNADQYKMYAVTIPGYGGTKFPDLPKNTAGTPWRENALAGLSELIDQYEIKNLVVVGHSWGVMVATQLAAKRQDVITKLIAIDGTIESTSWVPATESERLAKANKIVDDWGSKLNNAEEWSKFNGAAVGNTFGKSDSVTTETMNTKVKLVSSFMATDRAALIQYWRENLLIDLTSSLQKIKVPVLDIQSYRGQDQDKQRDQHLIKLQNANAPATVKTVVMYDTKHFIMYHRPRELDIIIGNFILDKPVNDYVPQ